MNYKSLNGDRSTIQGHPWSLPHKGHPGEWMPAVAGKLKLCANGYHYCRNERELLEFLGTDLYEIEVRGDVLDGDDKACAREARLLRRIDTWDERTARLFACDCAERVLSIWERRAPDDKRPHECIAVARRYARGEATRDELDAAWDTAGAAWAAAGDAWAAAWAAERDWQAQRLAQYLRKEATP
jgi:hypothetical protein